MSHAKILWVQDQYDGPINGLAEYNGEQVWFSRVGNPSIVSSTEIPIPYLNAESEETVTENRAYTLYRLSAEDMECVVRNHIEHCQETGTPLNHGDAIKMRRRPESSNAPSNLPENIAVALQPLKHLRVYHHKIVPSEVSGEVIATIKESDFSNYLVPRTFEITNK